MAEGTKQYKEADNYKGIRTRHIRKNQTGLIKRKECCGKVLARRLKCKQQIKHSSQQTDTVH